MPAASTNWTPETSSCSAPCPREYRLRMPCAAPRRSLREPTLDAKGLDAVGRRIRVTRIMVRDAPAQGDVPRSREAGSGRRNAWNNADFGCESGSRRPRGGRDISRIYESSAALRRMPSFCMRLRSVLGFRPSRRAAPWGPSIRQPVCLRTATMCWRSTSSQRRRRAARPARRRRRAAAVAGATGGPGSSSGATRELGPGRQDHRALDHVLELAHVAGPGVGERAARIASRGHARDRAGRSWRRSARRSSAPAAGCPRGRSRSGGSRTGKTFRR